MENRYSLRFETGERQGETIPIPASGMTIGRKPGNTLQVTDGSISGQHARLRVDGDHVLLTDLGSTNGTRVGSERLLQEAERRLAPGDVVTFGNVRVVFQDAKASSMGRGNGAGGSMATKSQSGAGAGGDTDGIEIEGLDEPAVTASAPAAAEDGLERVSAEVLARSTKRSFTGVVVVGLLALAGGAVWWWLNRSSGGDGGPAGVADVPGNLLARGYSFETDDDGFTATEGPAAFVKSGTARRSGAFGLEAEVAPGEWALHGSPVQRVNAGQELVARAALSADGAAIAALGIEFSTTSPGESPAADAPPVVVAWSAPRAAGGFEEVEVAAVVPAPWTRARVIVLARAEANGAAGSVRVDDVSLVVAGTGKPAAASVAGATLATLGTPATSAQLVVRERAFVAGLEFLASADAPSWAARAFTARAEGAALVVEPSAAGNAATGGVASLVVDGGLARVRLASIGADGYRTHGAEFERAGVTTLLVGSGVDLVRLELAAPATVTAVPDGAHVRLRLAPAGRIALQVDFAAERKEAGNVAYAARNAEQKGELGEAIAQWKRLLDGLPYEDSLVTEAEAARTRLVQKGLADLRAVQADAERAQFFRLPDLFRASRDAAATLAARYAGSEVETEAQRTIASLDAQIAGLEADRHAAERARLASILAALEAQGSTRLAAEVRAYLTNELAPAPGKEPR